MPRRMNSCYRAAGLLLTTALLGGATPDPQDPVVGVVLPESGSPANREFARHFQEGIEVAAAMVRQAGLRMELAFRDNQGTRAGTVRGVAELAAQGAIAILGPFSDENVAAAADVAPRGVPVLSPTARRLPDGRRGVYSLGVEDAGAGVALAEVVAGLGHANAVLVHPNVGEGALEAGSFENAFLELGGVVTRRLPYVPGTTTFAEELRQARSLAPPLLVVAAPPGDVELLAPQIAFFGLDTLDMQVAGTRGWTAASVLESVDQRHTDRVVAISGTPPGAGDSPSASFRAAYEDHFRRTLRSDVPGAGFDLVRIVLEAHATESDEAGDMVAALDRVQGFEGVTGTYSIEDGRLIREYYPVRIYNRELYPMSADPIPPPFGPTR